MILITPIAVTAVDWKAFLGLSSKLFERSLSTPLDAKGIKIGNPASFVSALGLFNNRDCDPLKIQREAGSLLRHSMASFLVCCERDLLLEVLSHSQVQLLDCELPEVFILSASLEEWRTTLINLASVTDSSDSLRLFAAALLSRFDTLGLTRLFENYTRYYKYGQLVLVPKQK